MTEMQKFSHRLEIKNAIGGWKWGSVGKNSAQKSDQSHRMAVNFYDHMSQIHEKNLQN